MKKIIFIIAILFSSCEKESKKEEVLNPKKLKTMFLASNFTPFTTDTFTFVYDTSNVLQQVNKNGNLFCLITKTSPTNIHLQTESEEESIDIKIQDSTISSIVSGFGEEVLFSENDTIYQSDFLIIPDISCFHYKYNNITTQEFGILNGNCINSSLIRKIKNNCFDYQWDTVQLNNTYSNIPQSTPMPFQEGFMNYWGDSGLYIYILNLLGYSLIPQNNNLLLSKELEYDQKIQSIYEYFQDAEGNITKMVLKNNPELGQEYIFEFEYY